MPRYGGIASSPHVNCLLPRPLGVRGSKTSIVLRCCYARAHVRRHMSVLRRGASHDDWVVRWESNSSAVGRVTQQSERS